MEWRWWHFDSVNHNMQKPGSDQVYRFKDKRFETEVDLRHGNYDFLMACDLDTNVNAIPGSEHLFVLGDLKAMVGSDHIS